MRRWILAALIATVLGVASAVPAGAVPNGNPFQEPFPATCEGIGVVMVAEAPGNAANSWGNGLHVVLVSLEGTFTAAGTGEVTTFSKDYGARNGLTTRYNCTVTFTDATGTAVANVVIAQIQPR